MTRERAQKAEETAPTAGELLKAARKNRDMSQEEAARRIGLTKATWGNLERGYTYATAVGKIEYHSKIETWVDAAIVVGADPAAVVEAAGLDPADIPPEALNSEGGSSNDSNIVIVAVRQGASQDEIDEAVQRVRAHLTK